jgi:hypothetical protein
MNFANYTDAVLSALRFNPRAQDVIARKQDILDGVYRVENLEPTSILFVGFTPAILSCRAKNIFVTEITDLARAYLTEKNVKFTYIPELDLVNYRKKFQCVVALDEYFTFAVSDQDQQNKIALICSLATDFVISTVRDYKNQDFKDRDFSSPIMVRNGQDNKVFVEVHDWDLKDRTRWTTTVHEIDSDKTLKTHGAFERRTMFFKQLAKFSADAGAVNFLVHKNLMYKSVIRKNYEHVISIQFEQ